MICIEGEGIACLYRYIAILFEALVVTLFGTYWIVRRILEKKNEGKENTN